MDPTILCASSHQADAKFGDCGGMQCVAISVTAIRQAKEIPILNWTRATLDAILERGNTRRLPNLRFLIVNDLKDQKKRLGIEFDDFPTFDGMTVSTGEGFPSLSSAIKTLFATETAGIAIVDGFAFALMKQGEALFLFNSHCTNELGQKSDTGVASIAKLDCVEEVVLLLKALANNKD